MKVLYAIQGDKMSHIRQASHLISTIKKYCEVDLLISNYQHSEPLPLEVKYNFKGLQIHSKKPFKIDIWNTYIDDNKKKFREEVKSLHIEDYDFVINDFEPVSAWACYIKKVPCVSLSHQAALLHKNSPQPKKKDLLDRFLLKNYAPSSFQFGFHFGRYSSTIYTPIIRSEIYNIKAKDKGYYLVYLPSFNEIDIAKVLSTIEGVHWKILSVQSKEVDIKNNITFYPYSDKRYIESLRNCTGLLCESEFEIAAEALHLGKKLMVICCKANMEQQYNAVALKNLGVQVIKKFKKSKLEKIHDWIESDFKIKIEYSNIVDHVIRRIFEFHVSDIRKDNCWNENYFLQYPLEDAQITKNGENEGQAMPQPTNFI